MALIQLGNVEEAVAALIVSNLHFKSFIKDRKKNVFLKKWDFFFVTENAQLPTERLKSLAGLILQVDHLKLKKKK